MLLLTAVCCSLKKIKSLPKEGSRAGTPGPPPPRYALFIINLGVANGNVRLCKTVSIFPEMPTLVEVLDCETEIKDPKLNGFVKKFETARRSEPL